MRCTIRFSSQRFALLSLLAAALCGLILAASARADGVPLGRGEVLAGVGNGKIKHFSPTGTLLDTLDTTTGSHDVTGMCFDPSGNLYSTEFGSNEISKFGTNGNLLAASFGSGFNADPESCASDAAGNIYVGQADGSRNILKFDPTGKLVATYAPAVSPRGTDWIDLAADQCTIHYTGEGSEIRTFNVCTNAQGPVFATLPASCFGHRIVADGGELVACGTQAFRVNSSGQVIQTYTPKLPGGGSPSLLFALNLDPDGTSFWTADISTGQIWRIDIASGNTITTFGSSPFVETAGLAVVGEITAAGDQAIKATGGATLNATEGRSLSGTVATFTDPDTKATAGEYSATISWGDGSTSSGTITGSAGSFAVAGTHTYTEEGTRNISVKIADSDNAPNAATANTSAKVADAALSAKGVSKSLKKKAFKGTIATFTDQDPAGTVSDYTATINWGDGHSSGGSVSRGFTVSGGHTYAKSGTHHVIVTIKDGGGSTATAQSTLTVKAQVAKVPAHLKITQLSATAPQTGCVTELAFIADALGINCTNGNITVVGTINKKARGNVHVKITADLPTGPVSGTGSARIHGGRWKTTITLPGINRDPNPPVYTVDARFNGSRSVKKGHAAKKRISFEVEPAGMGPL